MLAKKNTLIFLQTFICLGLVGTAQATTYYVSDCGTGAAPNCVLGADTNTGTSPQTPWRSYDKAQDQFGALQAGDQILFARGGAFPIVGATTFFNTRCQGTNPCVIADYQAPWGTGTEPRPLLLSNNTDVFTFEDGGNADHDEGYTIRNLRMRGTGNGRGFLLYNDVDHVLIDNVEIDTMGIGIYSAGANTPNAGANTLNEHITFRNNRVLNNGDQGWLGHGDDLLLENNYFENNGFYRANLNHNVYLSQIHQGIVRNNTLYRAAVINGGCQGVSLVVHGANNDLLIENNLIYEDPGTATSGCWGIAADVGYTSAESFTRLTIRGNTLANMGNTPIGVTSCIDCVIENNVIIHQQSGLNGAIVAPNKSRASNDAAMNNLTVRNNSLYINSPSGSGIIVGGEGTGHTVVSNAIHYLGTSGSFNCFSFGLANTAYSSIDYNLCYTPQAGGAEWEDGSGLLPAWQNASPFDDHSRTTNPLFTTPSAPLYQLRASGATSPLINNGHPTLSSLKDLTGQNRVGIPDIGAYEWGQSGDTLSPAAPRTLRAP